MAVLATAGALSACTVHPLNAFTTEGAPVMMVPVSYAGVEDRRGRFREMFCSVLEGHGHGLPDYMPCEDALTQLGTEPPATGKGVDLGMSTRHLNVLFVPGVGWDCVANWLELADTVGAHLRGLGFGFNVVRQESLSSSERNARSVRDALMALPHEDAARRVVLLGYSKGIVDILEAVVSYPEIRPRVAAVVSLAGAVGGSPLANVAGQSVLGVLRSWPGSECSEGDRGAVESLRTNERQRWHSENELPSGIRYYSLVTLPRPDRISTALLPTYNTLSAIDARNDGQVLFYDQVIPGSSLLGYLNADHWAAAVPISRNPKLLANLVVDRNAFPREALAEATLRLIDEDLP